MGLNTKFKLLPKTEKIIDGKSVYRIQALEDIPKYKVSRGDVGGFVETEFNLGIIGNCWIAENACAMDDSVVVDNALISGNCLLRKYAVVQDNAILKYNVLVTNHGKVKDNASIAGDVRIVDYGIAGGGCQIASHCIIEDHAYVCGDAFVGGQARISGNVCVVSGVFEGRVRIFGEPAIIRLKGGFRKAEWIFENEVIRDIT